MTKEISLDTNGRVSITNTRSFELSFRAIESEKDIMIPRNVKNYRGLTFAEVDAQVKAGNNFFVGSDLKGGNACILIDDEDTRNYMFGVTGKETETINECVITEKSVKSLFSIKDTKKFKSEILKYISGESDKLALVDMATKVGIDKATVAQKTAIEDVTGYKFSKKAEAGE